MMKGVLAVDRPLVAGGSDLVPSQEELGPSETNTVAAGRNLSVAARVVHVVLGGGGAPAAAGGR